jgi:hypothetical protein
MNRCYPFQGVGSSGAPPTSHSRWGSLTELLRHYALTVRWIIRCWRPHSQIVSVSFHATVGWTAADPSVHPMLKAPSWHVFVLIQTERRIDRRCPLLDRRIIRCYYLRCSSSAIHLAHLETWPSDHSTMSASIYLLRSVPTTPTLCTDGVVGSSGGVFSSPFLRVFNLDLCFNLTYLTCHHLASKNILSPHFCYK